MKNLQPWKLRSTGARIPLRTIVCWGGLAALLAVSAGIGLVWSMDWITLSKRPSSPARSEHANSWDSSSDSTPSQPSAPEKQAEPAQRDDTPASVYRGPSVNDLEAYQGYTLIAPMMSTKTYLIDMEGRIVHTWDSDCTTALVAHLLPNGHLLRTGALAREQLPFGGAGAGGRIQELTWEGELVWDFTFCNDRQLPHHDITKLANGNVLLIVWDRKTASEAIAAGRKPESIQDGHLTADSILEIKPTGRTTGEVVWEWHLWDHLIQELDKTRTNHGVVSAHPELVDLNFGDGILAPLLANKDEANKLRGLGYLGGPPGPGGPRGPIIADWTHINAVAYNPDLDQIVLSVHGFNEIWIIDHGTTTAEAASHSGGRQGKGGDLLYRWGNPRAYRSGSTTDQRLFGQHDAHFIPKGLPGEGHLLVFNNGSRRPDGSYSSVDEIVLPVDAEGRYTRKPGQPFGPARAQWSFTAPKKADLFSMMVSGAHRLPNGNTFICSGMNGTLLEVTPRKEIVWKYTAPAILEGGARRLGFEAFPPKPCEILPRHLQQSLHITPEQRKPLGELQQKVDTDLTGILSEEQQKLLQAAWYAPGGPGAAGRLEATFRPGQLMPPFIQDLLRLTREQERKLEKLQTKIDGELGTILTDEQKKQLKEGPGVPDSFGGFGTGLFRSYRYGGDHPGLVGKDLTPGRLLGEPLPR
jgi:hypothetical protein